MESTFDRLQIGERFSSPIFKVDPERARDIVRWAGYVHPLFTDPTYPATVGLSRGIVPGELVLLILGGLAEQTGIFDETTIALVRFESVEFKRPAMAGDSLRLDMEVIEKDTSSSGRRGFVTFKWTCFDNSDEEVLEAHAVLAFKLD